MFYIHIYIYNIVLTPNNLYKYFTMKIELICQCCNKPFETEFKFRDKKFCSRDCYFEDVRNGKTKMGRNKDEVIREFRECKVCGKDFEVKKKHSKEMCSNECRIKWGERDGVKEKRIESIKKTVQEKYGVDHVWNIKNVHQKTIDSRDNVLMGLKVSESLKNKTKEEWFKINQKKENTKELVYGDKHYNNNGKISESLLERYEKDGDEINKKRENTTISKYGVKSTLQLDICRSKLEEIRPIVHKKSIESRRRNELLHVIEKLLIHDLELNGEYIHGGTNNFKCKKCDNIFTSTVIGSGLIPICRKCNPPATQTEISKLIKDILEEYNIEYIVNDRKPIYPYELDFYIPKNNLAIEVNGNYYHSEMLGQKNKNYHINKTKLCNEKGIKLIHIFEDEINDKYSIVKSRILYALGLHQKKIFARKCIIKEITNKHKKDFLNENHIQGDAKDSIRYGLFSNDELISVMTFGKRKITSNKTSNWELIRFCNKTNHSVIGSFSKLLSYVLKNHNIQQFITYADIRWSGYDEKSTVYHKNNMIFNGYTPPSYFYMSRKNYNIRHHRFNFRKSKLVSEGFDPNKTEWEIMQERGFDRIWDCGNIKFSYTI